MRYAIFQVKNLFTRDYGFMSLKTNKEVNGKIDVSKYDFVYKGTIVESGRSNEEMLEELFETFNINHPNDYKGRSISTGDIILLGTVAYYCDSFGWQKIDLIKDCKK
jgi:hypothetical protein